MTKETNEVIILNCQEREERENISDGSFKQKEVNIFAPNFIESKKAIIINGLPANLDDIKESIEIIENALMKSTENTLDQRTEQIAEEISLHSLGATVELTTLLGDYWHEVAVVDFEANKVVTVNRMMVLNGFGELVHQKEYVAFTLVKSISVNFYVGLPLPMKVLFSENKFMNVEMYPANYSGIEGYLFADSNVVLKNAMLKKSSNIQSNLKSLFVPSTNLNVFLEENFNLQEKLSMVENDKKGLFVDSFLEVVNLVF
ncbi:hypothetical protein ABC382_01015 [Lysinibacillus sp. 1P01SD]|uniref:hypothetical protein n=1 Tax=Lysinibacillus sp. 1P01SD TaxID=3132285 RepID=UPI0039A169BF